mmetsp:Transcript_1134/g.2539  ORF Transcript_1134/g.2539 Transcript_1134/m.2539 type:complete len:244 (-) Transcript_1134:127-858(-)
MAVEAPQPRGLYPTSERSVFAHQRVPSRRRRFFNAMYYGIPVDQPDAAPTRNAFEADPLRVPLSARNFGDDDMDAAVRRMAAQAAGNARKPSEGPETRKKWNPRPTPSTVHRKRFDAAATVPTEQRWKQFFAFWHAPTKSDENKPWSYSDLMWAPDESKVLGYAAALGTDGDLRAGYLFASRLLHPDKVLNRLGGTNMIAEQDREQVLAKVNAVFQQVAEQWEQSQKNLPSACTAPRYHHAYA